LGSKYYSDNPVFDMKNTVVDLNIDMIGRSDKENEGKDYVYVIGSEMLSSELKVINEAANKITHNLELNYKYDDPNDTNVCIIEVTIIILQNMECLLHFSLTEFMQIIISQQMIQRK
jgi:hypothetical protein